MTLHTIGDVASLTRIPTKTLRYYEDVDLVRATTRAANGYRLYDERAVHELHFVKRSRDLGFSVDDVRRLLALWRDPHRAAAFLCASVGLSLRNQACRAPRAPRRIDQVPST